MKLTGVGAGDDTKVLHPVTAQEPLGTRELRGARDGACEPTGSTERMTVLFCRCLRIRCADQADETGRTDCCGLFLLQARALQEIDEQVNKKALTDIVEPAAAAVGYELVDLEFVSHEGEPILRIYIDGPEGITVDDCAKASRHIGVVLDAEDPISGNYYLEVSSPGIERPLVKPAHFEQFKGERVRVQLYTHHMGRKRFLGQMTDVDDNGIVIDVDGEPYELTFDQIEKARLQPEY